MSSGKPTLPFTGAYPALLQFQFSLPTSPGKRQHMCTDSSLWDNSEKKKEEREISIEKRPVPGHVTLKLRL